MTTKECRKIRKHVTDLRVVTLSLSYGHGAGLLQLYSRGSRGVAYFALHARHLTVAQSRVSRYTAGVHVNREYGHRKTCIDTTSLCAP